MGNDVCLASGGTGFGLSILSGTATALLRRRYRIESAGHEEAWLTQKVVATRRKAKDNISIVPAGRRSYMLL